jgi:hypothetical protein
MLQEARKFLIAYAKLGSSALSPMLALYVPPARIAQVVMPNHCALLMRQVTLGAPNPRIVFAKLGSMAPTVIVPFARQEVTALEAQYN